MTTSTTAKRTRNQEAPALSNLRICKLQIENYKAIDSLSVEFAEPTLPGDPDVTVIGSKNGVGKTSVLEAASFAVLAVNGWLIHGKNSLNGESAIPELDVCVRAGAKSAEIVAVFLADGREATATVTLNRNGHIVCRVSGNDLARSFPAQSGQVVSGANLGTLIRRILGFDSEPVLYPGLVHLHSYRRVSPMRLDLGALVAHQSQREPTNGPATGLVVNTFKLEVLLGLLAEKDLFENLYSGITGASETLNKLLETYAHGRIEKIQSSEASCIDLRVSPLDGGPSFSFDGLSSGQKEIISTLFLTWRHTNSRPSIVLIDEPELHLNAEWHAQIIRSLLKLAPQNQFIFATHSEDVFGYVPSDRRLMLNSGGAK